MTSLGDELRRWRKHRRYTQMDLAREADVSTRHLSCVETGKSAPSRVLVLTLCETLGVPLQETNHWLTLAGFAPAFRTAGLEGAGAQPVRAAVEFLLRRHHPYPAVVVDPGWNAVLANDAYLAFAAWLRSGRARAAEPATLHDPPAGEEGNALVPLFDTAGLRPMIRNFDRFAAHVVSDLRRAARDEPAAANTLRTLEALGIPESVPDGGDASRVVVPLVFDAHGITLRLFTTMTMFASSVDAVVASLRVETFFAEDDATERHLLDLFDPRDTDRGGA